MTEISPHHKPGRKRRHVINAPQVVFYHRPAGFAGFGRVSVLLFPLDGFFERINCRAFRFQRYVHVRESVPMAVNFLNTGNNFVIYCWDMALARSRDDIGNGVLLLIKQEQNGKPAVLAVCRHATDNIRLAYRGGVSLVKFDENIAIN